MKLPVLALAVGTVALALPLLASASASFRTPGRAAYCGLSEGEGPAVLLCWTPNDGFGIWMRVHSRPRHDYNKNDRGFYDDSARVLRFGQTWIKLGFRCTSRSTGLTCTNRAGHGWWLGRYKGYRVF